MKALIVFLFVTQAFANVERIEEGRRLVKIAGCNDCHTPRFAESGGNLPEKDWLVGSPVGFKGPWGTTYASNLRLLVKTFKEKPFIKHIRNKNYLPPMPGYALNAMTDKELGSVYAFIASLGPAGTRLRSMCHRHRKLKARTFTSYPLPTNKHIPPVKKVAPTFLTGVFGMSWK